MVSITSNIRSVAKRFDDVALKQVPFALSQAMNDSALDVKKAEEAELVTSLDAPTPFTQRAIFHERASKRKLGTRIGVKRVQSGYLRLQVDGGVRKPKGKALVLPVGMRLNKYGNMGKGSLKRRSAKPNVFVASKGKAGTKHLTPGIYQRPRKEGGDPKLLVSFKDKAQYRKRWDFYGVARKAFPKGFGNHFSRRLAAAIATSSPR